MKKRIVVFALGLMLLGQITAYAQSLSATKSDFNAATYSFTAPDLNVVSKQFPNGTFSVVTMPGSTPSTEIGRPDLPIITQMIEIPLCDEVEVKLSDVQFKAVKPLGDPMMPVQPAPSKADRTPLPFVMDSAYYANNAMGNHPMAWVEQMGVGRDRNLALLRISPVAYNPVTGEMQVVTKMTVTLTYKNVDVAGTRQMHSLYYSPDFAIGNNLMGMLPCSKDVRDAAPIHYLIVAHSSFRGFLDSFVDWKKRQGYLVTIAYTDDQPVGTTNTAIANFVKSFYTNATAELPAPTYLLLVGDHQQIPAFNARCSSPDNDHVTDLYYVTWTDGDNLPDCYMGRFSARNIAELTPQVEKTIFYERYDFPDDSYLGRGVLIAGEDRGYAGDNAYNYADPAMDYVAKTYVNAANGYNSVYYYKNNVGFAPAGVSVTGCSQTTASAAALRSLYNTGCGWVNYSAHGYDNEWSTPSFTTTHVNSMTNTDKPGIMIGNCCLSGKFNTNDYDACLGEALLRKGNNAGAVAYFGGTNSTYWPHDFCWSVGVRTNFSNTMNTDYSAYNLGMYDRLFHTHNEAYSAWRTTAGSMNVAGNTAVQAYGSYSLYYWEIYELFGDPSLMPWLSVAEDMVVDASPVIPTGTTEYQVQAAPHAYVALTTPDEHELLCAAYADNQGMAVLSLPATMTPGTYELAITAQNCKPYFQEVTMTILDGPYVLITAINPSSVVKPDEMLTFDLTITNVGNRGSSGSITLAAGSDNVSVVQPGVTFSNCNPGDTITITGVCPTYISRNAKNGDVLNFEATVDFGGNSPSVKRKRLTVVAPKLVVSNVQITPNLTANTTSIITCNVANEGADTTADLSFELLGDYGLTSQAAEPVQVGQLVPGDSRTLAFNVTMRDSLPNTIIPFCLYAVDGGDYELLDTLVFRCGNGDEEDFESGTLTHFNWSHNSSPWVISNVTTFDGSFSARSKRNLADRTESRMTISWNAPVDDSISFYYKVSSEESYDKFTFFIDGVEKLSASGNVDWTRASFPVAAGNRIFSFSYTKDYSFSRDSDCVWIDNVVFPFTGRLSEFVFDTVCMGNEYEFAGQSVPTDQLGVFNYFDSTNNVWQYLTLSVVEAPQVSIEVVGISTPGSCVLLKAHGANSYVWNTGDSTDHIVVCPESAASYSVTGYRGDCSGTASTTLLDINAPDAAPTVMIYPNPAHSMVNVCADQIGKVELVNLTGQCVGLYRANGNAVNIDLSKLPNGIYFVRVETADSVVVKKLVRN